MQVRDLFVLVLKLVAIIGCIDIISTALPTIMLLFTLELDVLGHNKLSLLTVVLSLLFLILLYVFAAKIVDKIQVEKGFSSTTIQTNSLTMTKIAQFAIFCIGLGLFIRDLPPFLTNALVWFKAKAVDNPYEYVQTGNYWFISLFNLIIGFLLVTNTYRIAHWVIKGQEKGY